MRTLFQTISSKLLLSFATFTVITIFILLTTFWFNLRRDEVRVVTSTLDQVDSNIQLSGKLIKDFFSDEMINPAFYQTGKSDYLEQHKQVVQSIKNDLRSLEEKNIFQSFGLNMQIDLLIEKLNNYEVQLIQAVELIKLRGFKDYGLEGVMRTYIHKIENSNQNFDMAKMLMIRRHEKDFILRKEEKYIQKFLTNLQDGISYYEEMFGDQSSLLDEIREKARTEVERFKTELAGLDLVG